MNLEAARISFFCSISAHAGRTGEDTWQKTAEVRQKEALILGKILILNTLLKFPI